MPKVSVVVPVYNVEKYLDKCLNSLVYQTLDDIEIVVINDGTKDNSQKIIDKYVQSFPQKVFSYTKPNGGLSDARNFGISKCHGKYIGFIDGDDYANLNMFKDLYQKAIKSNFDVVVCDINYISDNESKCVSSLVETDLMNKNEIKKQMINIYPAAWNKIYKRELFDSGVLFKKNVWYEDVEFLYRLFPYINTIGAVKKPLINYVQREGAITKTFDKRLYNYINNWNGIIDFYKEKGFYDEYKDEIEYCYCRYLLATFLKQATNFSKSDYNMAVNEALNNIKSNFPNYKKNKYLNKTIKGIYIKFFNKFFAKILYIKNNK